MKYDRKNEIIAHKSLLNLVYIQKELWYIGNILVWNIAKASFKSVSSYIGERFHVSLFDRI